MFTKISKEKYQKYIFSKKIDIQGKKSREIDWKRNKSRLDAKKIKLRHLKWPKKYCNIFAVEYL